MLDNSAGAVQEFAKLAQAADDPKVVEVPAGSYVDRQLFLPPAERIPEPVELHTLDSLVDYVQGNPDGIEAKAFVLVGGPGVVDVVGPLTGRPIIREVFARATHFSPSVVLHSIGQLMAIETLVIGLQAEFEEGGDRDALLQILGNLQDQLVSTLEDDGVTQTVQVRAGIARRAEAKLPRVVTLETRFATFPELGVIARRFVFRMKSGAKDQAPPTAALIEADPTWEHRVAAAIHAYLEQRLAGRMVIR